MNVYGQIKLPIDINSAIYNVNFMIINDPMTYEIILGMDFLSRHGGNLDFNNNTLTLNPPLTYNCALSTELTSLSPQAETVVEQLIHLIRH